MFDVFLVVGRTISFGKPGVGTFLCQCIFPTNNSFHNLDSSPDGIFMNDMILGSHSSLSLLSLNIAFKRLAMFF